MTIPTTLPVPSQSPIDLLFNAEKFDQIVSSSALTYVDRLGVSRKTAAGAAAALAVVNPRGPWATATLYQPRDVVSNSGTWYIALDTHTSGATFAGDQAAHWRVHQGVLSSDLADTADAAKGAGMVGWATGTNYTAGVGKKLRQIVHVEDEGAVGDGTTNDYAAIAAAATKANARGVPLVFDGTKTYSVDVASWSFPAGTVLQFNGATIKCATTSTGNTVWLTINSRCRWDELKVSIPTGVRRDRAVLITGDDYQGAKVTITSVDQQANSEGADAALQITAGARGWIGLCRVTNYDRAFLIATTDQATIGRLDATSYVRGLYAYDNENLLVMGGHIRVASPNAAALPGHNGVLLGCTATDAQHDCTFRDFVVEDAGEHAWRMGGPAQQSNMRFVDCVGKNAGGCGFKALGTDSDTPSDDGIPTSYNRNLILERFIAEDVGKAGTLSATNRAGILIRFVQGAQIATPIVRKKAQTYGAQYGMVVDASQDINVTTPMFSDAQFDGLLAWASDGDIEFLNINGGAMRANGRHGVYLLVDTGKTMNRPQVHGVNLDSNVGNAFRVNVNGTLQGGLLRAKSFTNGGAGQSNSTNITLQLVTTGAEVTATPLAGISARRGSTADDGTNLYLLKGTSPGTWTAL
ncbi:MAG: hypothetical protein KIT35_09395 [Piscinibacter sp.]|uniref:hypothetical protein n=1 Tax=Piscinibacter sp. TaxID=1903157 RepID=UPI00258458DE|nr:hypothetical protein [Piscinibacter sp.]MCW5664036.1 hypothetical protein [Piscinibacter sp.]